MTDDVVRLVLARIEGRRPARKASRLPRAEVPADSEGRAGDRNGVVCGSIEREIGIHGNSTAVLDYDGAKGWLVGRSVAACPRCS